jgi:predicted GTPase
LNDIIREDPMIETSTTCLSLPPNNMNQLLAGQATMQQEDVWNSDGMILVMGATGAGKSYFINQLKQGCVTVGHSLQSRRRDPFQTKKTGRITS